MGKGCLVFVSLLLMSCFAWGARVNNNMMTTNVPQDDVTTKNPNGGVDDNKNFISYGGVGGAAGIVGPLGGVGTVGGIGGVAGIVPIGVFPAIGGIAGAGAGAGAGVGAGIGPVGAGTGVGGILP